MSIEPGSTEPKSARKHKRQYTSEEILAMDAEAMKRSGGRVKFGSSKHRQARVKAYIGKQKRKKQKRKHR